MHIVNVLTEVSKPIGVTFDIGGNKFFVHPAIFFTYVIAIFIVIFCMLVSYKVKRADPSKPPRGLVFFGEYFVTSINSFTKNNLSESKKAMAPYLGMLAMFILISNLSSLIAFVPPTSDYNVTLTLALITMVLAQYFNIKSNGFKGYLVSFTEPFALLLPNNLLDLITTPLSMSLRLFGNILAGGIIMSLIYSALYTGLSSISLFVTPIIPVLTPALHAYFDVFTGGIQTFVFVLLTAITVEG